MKGTMLCRLHIGRFSGGYLLLTSALLLTACPSNSDKASDNTSEKASDNTSEKAPSQQVNLDDPKTEAPAEAEKAVEELAVPEEPEPLPPNLRVPEEWKGPYLIVTRGSTGIYSETKSKSHLKIGYAQAGGRVPVKAEIVNKEGCSAGWREIISGGFICADAGTLDPDSPQGKFAARGPKLDQILPYRYVRAAYAGVPLYKSVPTREQFEHYEAHVKPKAKKKAEECTGADCQKAEPPPPSEGEMTADGGILPAWRDEKKALHEVALSELETEADGILSKRMLKGFYVAVDRSFQWENRTWLKTTKGLVTPSDLNHGVAGSEFHGIDLQETTQKLPIAFVSGAQKSIQTYEIDQEKKQAVVSGSLKRFESAELDQESFTVGKNEYRHIKDGKWVRTKDVRIADIAELPTDLKKNERWVDVSLDSQTVVAYIGETPVYATLTSTGRYNRNKERDHSTPTGEYWIREKHLTATMDGDGTAAGDTPYSIEEVPFISYFYKAYALHGAFWHQNYGNQMSHGCVNLAPLDAKFFFFFTDPWIPPGWHGAWANDNQPGSRVRVHR